MTIDSDTRALLEYLNGLGWNEVYRNGAQSVAAAETPGEAPPVEARPAANGSASKAAIARDARAGEAPDGSARERASTLALLADEAAKCVGCKLSETRNKVVFGSGNPNADLMFIGEGPGANEDRQGLPFVGAAGELLSKIIAAIGFEREDCYIANIVKCRPPGNRDPETDEVIACRGYLERQIALVEPRVIVALGRVAAQTLLSENRSLGKLRGEWFVVQGVDTRVTYHPAALLRNAGYKRPTWEDMQVVRDRLKEASRPSERPSDELTAR